MFAMSSGSPNRPAAMRLSFASRCGLPIGLLFMKNSVLVDPVRWR